VGGGRGCRIFNINRKIPGQKSGPYKDRNKSAPTVLLDKRCFDELGGGGWGCAFPNPLVHYFLGRSGRRVKRKN